MPRHKLTADERELGYSKTRVIRIKHSTFARLQNHAEPLADKPSDVIDRVLDMLETATELIMRYESEPETE